MSRVSVWKALYNEQADLYEELVRHEDYAGHLLPAIRQLCALEGARVIEFGAGTGRMTALLRPLVSLIHAFDFTPAMLQQARQKLQLSPPENWSLTLADSRYMPLRSRWADLTIQGWSFLQLATWNPETWQQEVDAALAGMMRLLRPGGTAFLIETQGTGTKKPQVPDFFNQFYAYLAEEWEFQSTWLRTDYRFPDLTAAARIVAPFFGQAMLDNLIETADGWVLPECTGLWWRAAP